MSSVATSTSAGGGSSLQYHRGMIKFNISILEHSIQVYEENVARRRGYMASNPHTVAEYERSCRVLAQMRDELEKLK